MTWLKKQLPQLFLWLIILFSFSENTEKCSSQFSGAQGDLFMLIVLSDQESKPTKILQLWSWKEQMVGILLERRAN